MPHIESNNIKSVSSFAGFNFINAYADLPSSFYSLVQPTHVDNPKRIKVNHCLANELSLDVKALGSATGTSMFAGNIVPPTAKPLAQAYAGHQFGHFNPQLGDGRAILLGDIIDCYGKPRDIQLKGAGPTMYSRSGDGRAAIGPVIREYILSEAMHALGIKTTRALAAVTTGESVYRQTSLPGAVITRVASSHVRIGTFEYFRSQGATESIKQLANFVIQRHYPEANQSQNPYLTLLEKVIDAQASLVASWMCIGFIHGVMNTDNMSICGETIDYGPCAFMNNFDPATVFSSIDREGRYAYGNQGNIALWNLTRLAECLLPLFSDDTTEAISLAEEQLDNYSRVYQHYWLNGMLAKIGIFYPSTKDKTLIDDLLKLMKQNNIDFTQFFRGLSEHLINNTAFEGDHLESWLNLWKIRLVNEPDTNKEIATKMNAVNPIYIPRNHRIEEVLHAAETNGDYTLMEEMLNVLSRPFSKQKEMERYEKPPKPNTEKYQTFCGT